MPRAPLALVVIAVTALFAACASDPGPAGAPDASGTGADDVRADAAATDARSRDDAAEPADQGERTDAGPWPPVRRERSLVWTDPRILDDPTVVSFAAAVAAFAGDGHGGAFFDAWLRRFGATAHSERAAPVLLADELRTTLGADPAAWDLTQLPFRLTGVHNRIDLVRDGHCGELRISAASTHLTIQPFHFIFLLRMRPEPSDADCRGLAIRWAELSALDDTAFFAAARQILAEHLVPERVILAETLEFTVSPWEWRQWVKTASNTLDNPPLFQTVDSERLNQPGADRTAFLAWVEANAAELDARRLLIPETFRGASARVLAGVPRVPLSLDGIDASLIALYPQLRQKLEIVGCPTCHTADADFVQTSPDRRFSPFYDKELDARARALERWVQGTEPAPPYGPLQLDPVLPP